MIARFTFGRPYFDIRPFMNSGSNPTAYAIEPAKEALVCGSNESH
jgi:hypothetical protein